MTQKKFQDSEATRIIAALEARAERKAKDGAQVSTTWGTVGAVDAANKFASAYLYGETNGAYMSEGFRIPEAMYLTVGDKVKLAINYATGERWVAETHYPATAFKKIAIDLATGALRSGDGTAAPVTRLSPSDLYLGVDGSLQGTAHIYGTGASEGGELTLYGAAAHLDWSIDNYNGAIRFFVGANVYLDISSTRFNVRQTGGITFGTAEDINLYRASATELRTDDEFSALRLTVRKDGAVSGIYFPAATNDPGSIEHLETANVAEMRFIVSDDRADSDFFTFGSAPTSVWSEALRIGAAGTITWSGGPGLGDTNLYRSMANTLKTDDSLAVAGNLYVGDYPNVSSASIGGGAIELRSPNPLIDFSTDNSMDYGARIVYDLNVTDGLEFGGAVGYYFDAPIVLSSDVNLYRAAANELKTDDALTVVGNLVAALAATTNTTFTVAGGGTATFTGKSVTWQRIGRIIVFSLEFSIGVAGSGATVVTITGTGLPASNTVTYAMGSRGGVGVLAIAARFGTAGNFDQVKIVDSNTSVTGADLAAGAAYRFVGAYLEA